MIRHILFWKYTAEVKQAHKEKEMLVFLQKSVETMEGKIPGLLKIEIQSNLSDGYDLVFYAEFEDLEALHNFQNHPLHVAHRDRCKAIVTDRLVGDIESK